jgi:hypothetical protein
MEHLKVIIQSDYEKKKLFQQIMDKDKNYWRKFSNPEEILRWLHNFSGEREIYLALILANNIIYYNSEEIRYLADLILSNRVKLWLLDQIFPNKVPANIDKWYEKYLKSKCVLVGYGRAKKSAQLMMYYSTHTQVHRKLPCMEFSELLQYSQKRLSKETVFLLDDFIGSGNQAIKMWSQEYHGLSLAKVSKKNTHLKFVYLCLVGMKKGKNDIEKKTPIKVILGDELNEKFKCFSAISEIYRNTIERADAKRIMSQKGRMLFPQHPLGYRNMQLALAFHYNTPNDSLPVIWKRMSDGGWWPLFERYEG